MTGKEKIRKEVERLRNLHQMKYQQLDTDSSMNLVECGKRNLCNELLSFIDSLQEEPVKIKKGCKYRCLSDMVNKDTGNIAFIGCKIYLAPEDNTLVTEENGWRCDTSENASNFELVEEPQVKESAKVQHVNDMCKENGNSLTQEPVSEELEDALAREWKGYNDRGAATVDALEDNTQELAFAKGFYRGAKWGKNQAKVEIQAQSMALAHGCPKEPITEDLGEYINELPKAMNDET